MPLFRYKAISSAGERLEGELEAVSREAVIQNLQNAGHLPVSASEVSGRYEYLHKFFSIFQDRNKTSKKDVMLLLGELSTLLHAGLPLDNALKTLEGLSTSVAQRKTIHNLRERIQAGSSLSDAMSQEGTVFTRLQINMIRAGEAGGNLGMVVERLAAYLERMADLRSSVLTALIYPVLLVILSLVSLFVLMTFVVPQFIPLFEDAGQALPWLTQAVFGTANLLKQTWWIVICLVVVIAWILDKQLQRPENRKKFDAWCLKLPLVGMLITHMETARFARTLGTLISNGVPLLQAVKLVEDIIDNEALREVMGTTHTELQKGRRLAIPLKESGLFPTLCVQLIEVGEESGNLESMLIKVANIYDTKLQITVRRLLTVLEPVLILGLGAMIGIIIISILVAMLGLNDLVI